MEPFTPADRYVAGNHAQNAVGSADTPDIAALPPPPPNVCQVHLTFTTRDYCGRPLFRGANRCYWHLETEEKYEPDFVISYFGPGATLKPAIEREVLAKRSLEMAHLVKHDLMATS